MKIIGKALLLLFVSINVQAQNVDQILSNHFRALGGLEKLKSLKTMKLDGKVPTPQGEFNFSIYRKAPNSFKMEMEVQGTKMIPQAYDGTTAWALNPFAGTSPQKLPEEQSRVIAEQAVFEHDIIDYKKKGHSVELEGKEEIDGIDCFKLKLTKNQNNNEEKVVEYLYFDSKSFLQIMTRSFGRIGPQKGQEVETYFSDYQELQNGLIMAFYIETKTNGQIGQQITITNVETNIDLSDDIFEYAGQ